MKEYNWRNEREKFRPDFQKKSTDTGVTAPVDETEKNRAGKWWIIAGVVLLAVIITAAIFISKGSSEKNNSAEQEAADSAIQLANSAEKHKSAVGIAVLTIELKNGQKSLIPIGSAWAFGENRFATNAHVAFGFKTSLQQAIMHQVTLLLRQQAQSQGLKSEDELLKQAGPQANGLIKSAQAQIIAMIKDVKAEIIINGTQKKSYYVSHIQIHKSYNVENSTFNPDVAVLTIDGKHDNYFKLADKNTLHQLKSGTPIAFLGFPMESLQNNNVNTDNPVASMQSGIVVAVSNFEMKDGGSDGNFLLRHNLPATGGASGSPIFNTKGEVVALLHAGNVVGQVSANGQVTRIPSAAQINFGVRVDLLAGVGEAVAVKEFLKL